MVDEHPLANLLEKERSAILEGDFDGLTTMAPEKERLLSSLPEQSLDMWQLRRISAAVSRNQTLLAATIDGVRAVNERIQVLRKARDGFDSYDRTGGRTHVGAAKSGFERKA